MTAPAATAQGAAAGTPATTLVTCIEAGFLEGQVLLLLRSLRRLPCELARIPVLVVQPRPGPPVARATRRALEELGARLHRADLAGEHAFHGTINKSAALAWAEGEATTEYVTWMDGDTLFLGPPEGLLPAEPFDFAARAGEDDLGTDGADRTADFWQVAAERLGVPLEGAATIESFPDGRPIREYYHGGVFTMRRSLGIAARHFALMKALIDARIGSKVTGVYHHDQMAMTLAALDRAPRRIRYPRRLNHDINVSRPADLAAERLSETAVLHYHGCFFPDRMDRARAILAELPDDVRAMVGPHLPIRLGLAPHRRLWRKLLSRARARRAAEHARDCVLY